MLMKKRKNKLIKKNHLPTYRCWKMKIMSKRWRGNSKKMKPSIKRKCRKGYLKTIMWMTTTQMRKVETGRVSDGELM